MRIVSRILVGIEEFVPAALLGLICLLITIDVVGRYGFNSPLRGAAEVSLLLAVWLIFLAWAGITRRGMNIAIDSLYVKFSPRWQFICDLFSEALLVIVMMIVAGNAILLLATGKFIILPATGLPKQLVTLAIPVGAILASSHSVVRIGAAWRKWKQERELYRRDSEPFDGEAFSDMDTQEVTQVSAAIERRLSQ